MGKKSNTSSSGETPKKIRKAPPSLTAEGRENYLISLAYDLVEKRLLEGTATSQETTHFLRMGSLKERKEIEILEKQKRLLDAKADSLESSKRMETLYDEAIKAMRRYNGERSSDEYPE